MTPDEIKSAITGWCNQESGLQLVEDRSEPGADFVLGLRSSGHGSASVPVDVSLQQGAERLAVRSNSTASPAELDALLSGRPALVRSEASGGAPGSGASLVGYVYLDGLSRHTFVTTVDEVAKTRSLLDGPSGEQEQTTTPAEEFTTATSAEAEEPAAASASPDPWSTRSAPDPWASPSPQPSPQPEPWTPGALPSEQPGSGSLPAPTFGAAAGAGTSSPSPSPSPSPATYTPLSGQPAAQQQPQPQPQPAAAAFAPTHTVPPQGMQAWAAPDPAGAIVATLGGGLPIQVTEVRGAWAHVLCSNGWTGWVDGRIIGVAR